MSACVAPSVLSPTLISYTGLAQDFGCIQNTLDPGEGTIAFNPMQTVTSGTAGDTEDLPFSSPVPPFELRALTTEEFRSPAGELDSDSPSPLVLNLQEPPPANEAPFVLTPIMFVLAGIAVFSLTVPIFIRKKRMQIQNEPDRWLPMAFGFPGQPTASNQILVYETADEILRSSTRRCRYCTSGLVRRSQKRNALEQHLLPLLLLTPFRCLSCRRRFYGLGFLQ